MNQRQWLSTRRVEMERKLSSSGSVQFGLSATSSQCSECQPTPAPLSSTIISLDSVFFFCKKKLGAGRKLNFISSFTPARPALPHYHINPHNTSNQGQSSNSSPSKSDILLWREHCSTMEKLRDQIDFSAKTFSMLTFEFLEQICQNWRFSVLGSFCWHCYGYSPHMGPEVLSLNFIL